MPAAGRSSTTEVLHASHQHARAGALIVGAVLLGACHDEPTFLIAAAPSPPQFAAGGNGNGSGPSSLELIEADYAEGLLDKDNVNRCREYAVSDADHNDGYEWRASAIVYGNGGPSVVPISLDNRSAGSGDQRLRQAGQQGRARCDDR